MLLLRRQRCTPRETTTLIPLNAACLSRGSSQGSNSSLRSLRNTARADAIVATSAAVGCTARNRRRTRQWSGDDMVATDIGEHVTDDTEGRDNRNAVGCARGEPYAETATRSQHDGADEGIRKHQRRPCLLLLRKIQHPLRTAASGPPGSCGAGHTAGRRRRRRCHCGSVHRVTNVQHIQTDLRASAYAGINLLHDGQIDTP